MTRSNDGQAGWEELVAELRSLKVDLTTHPIQQPSGIRIEGLHLWIPRVRFANVFIVPQSQVGQRGAQKQPIRPRDRLVTNSSREGRRRPRYRRYERALSGAYSFQPRQPVRNSLRSRIESGSPGHTPPGSAPGTARMTFPRVSRIEFGMRNSTGRRCGRVGLLTVPSRDSPGNGLPCAGELRVKGSATP